jgi:hypothetical protein
MDGNVYGFRPDRKDIFLFFSTFISPLGPTDSSIQWVPTTFSGIKRLGREFYHTPRPSADVKNEWGYTATPACLLGIDRDNFSVYPPFDTTQPEVLEDIVKLVTNKLNS